MKKIISLFILLMFVQSSFSANNDRGKKVLIYTKNGKGYVHENIDSSVQALKEICLQEGIKTDVSDEPSVFTEDNLANYDAIIFSNSNNEGFDTDEQRNALKEYIRNGHGFAAIHSANATERKWPWYWALVGGKFIRHAPYQEFDVVVIDENHPSTAVLPARWTIEDECYYSNHLNPDIQILLAADMSTIEDTKKEEYPGEIFGNYFPLVGVMSLREGEDGILRLAIIRPFMRMKHSGSIYVEESYGFLGLKK